MRLLVTLLSLLVAFIGVGCMSMVLSGGGGQGRGGVLVANVGMTWEEVKKRSSLDIGEGIYRDKGLDGSPQYGLRDRKFVDSNVRFDWEVAGTGLRFEGCRYYTLQTGFYDDPRLVIISIGTAQKAMTWEEFKPDVLAVQDKLHADGWKPVRSKRGETADGVLLEMLGKEPKDDFDLGGATYGKGDTVLHFHLIRRGETSRGDVDYVHRVELEPRAEWDKNNISGDILPR